MLEHAAAGRARAERPDAGVRVVDERHAEPLGGDRDVDRAVVAAGARRGHADLAPAETLRLRVPPGRLGEARRS